MTAASPSQRLGLTLNAAASDADAAATMAAVDTADSRTISTICEALWTGRDVNSMLSGLSKLAQVLSSTASPFRTSPSELTTHGEASRVSSAEHRSTNLASYSNNEIHHHHSEGERQDWDPSDIFLAIQGAALRFRAAAESTETDVEAAQFALQQQFQEAALEAVAVLGEVYVGPAWHTQQRQRVQHRMSRQDGGMAARRQSSGASLLPPQQPIDSSFSQRSTPAGTYPHIPEALVPAMLRFAASVLRDEQGTAPPTTTRILSLQRRIVASLCVAGTSESDASVSPSSDWTIPNVQEPLTVMMLVWLDAMERDSATVTPHMLEFLQTIHALYAQGWTPCLEQRESIVEASLVVALRVATRALSLPGDVLVPTAATDAVLNLACGAVAVAILALLASNCWIPAESVEEVLETICKVHALGTIQRQGNDLSADIATQLDAFMDDMEDASWFLLANEALADASVDVLMKIIAKGDDPRQHDGCDDEATPGQRAGSALKLLSGAFWVVSDGGATLTHLRIHWLPLLECILPMLIDATAMDGADGPLITPSTSVFALEIFLALCRAMENEQRGTDVGCKFAELEWSILTSYLEQITAPWLGLEAPSGTTIREAAILFVRQLCRTLEYWTIFHNVPFADYKTQEMLYLILLRSIVPGMKQHVEIVSLAVVECWSKYGFFPFRLEEWSRTASKLLDEAFRTDSAGIFVHKPSVRLKALNALTADEPGSISPSEPERAPSLLVLTQHMREQFINFVEILLPALKMIVLSPEIVDADVASPFEVPTILIDPSCHKYALELGAHFEHFSPITRYTSLAYYAVQLMGRLFHASSGHKDHRFGLINLLRLIAMSECEHEIAFRIRLAAALELEKCMAAGFTTLPHAHASIPRVIDALADIFVRYAGEDSGNSTRAIVMATSALDPLTRLRVAIDYHIAFRPRDASINLPSDVLHRFFVSASPMYRSAVVETFGAPNLEVASDISISSSVKTAVSLDRIVVAALLLLQRKCGDEIHWPEAQRYSYMCMRTHCYDILRHYFLASLSYKIPVEAAQSVFTVCDGAQGADPTEIEARSLALAQYAEHCFIIARTDIHGVDAGLDYFATIWGMILSLFESELQSELATGCHAICALVPFLTDADSQPTSICTVALGCLLASLDKLASSCAMNGFQDIHRGKAEAILVVMSDLLLSSAAKLPFDLCRQGFELFVNYADSSSWTPDSYCNLLGLYSAVSLFDTLDNEGLVTMRTFLLSAQTNDVCVQALNGLADEHERRLGLPNNNVNASEAQNSDKNRVLDSLVNDEQLLRQFKYEGASVTGRAAWLIDGRFLFTCRVGSSQSRYAGYIELVVRSQTERTRTILKIPGQALMDDPDGISLALGMNPTTRESDKEQCVAPTYVVPEETQDVLAHFEALMSTSDNVTEPDAVESYEDVLARFDAVMGQEEVVDATSNGAAGETSSTSDSIAEWLAHITTNTKEEVSHLRQEVDHFLQSRGISLPRPRPEVLRKLRYDDGLSRAIAVLDFAPIMSTHKVALLYDQSAESKTDPSEIGNRLLSTKNCSPAFHKFASGMGSLVAIKSLKSFSGGLDTSGYETDGTFALFWTNLDENRSLVASTSIVFHVVSLMPNHGNGNVVNRKRHVGNDFVVICFSDRGSDAIIQYDLLGGELIGGAFGLVVIFVTNYKPGIYRVNVRVRPVATGSSLDHGLSRFVKDYSISEKDGPTLVRNIAFRADLACRALTGAPDALPNYVYRTEVMRDMKRHAM